MVDFTVYRGHHRANIVAKTEKARLKLKADFGANDGDYLPDGFMYINRNAEATDEIIEILKKEGFDIETR